MSAELQNLGLDGRWSSSANWFRRNAETAIVAATRGRRTKVGAIKVRLDAMLFWVVRAEIELSLPGRRVVLTGDGLWDWPWTLAPAFTTLEVVVDGKQLGRLEITDAAVIARDLAGVEIGRWHTGRPIGSALIGDEPHYAALRLPGHATAKLRLPLRRTESRRLYDFEGKAFLIDIEANAKAAPWLLAFLALAAQASLHLLSRSPDRARPVIGQR